MKPIDQTKFGDEGNCFAACVASILELPIEQVPDAMNLHRAGKSWRKIFNEWLYSRGLWYQELKAMHNGRWTMWMPPTYHIIGDESPRDCLFGHAVVGFQGKLIHDPHPSRSGIADIEDYGFFVHVFQKDGPVDLFVRQPLVSQVI